MTPEELKSAWKQEETCARIQGWDFSHIHGRYEEEEPPWDYAAIIHSFLRDDMKLLDYDTGGGEFLLSLGHPYQNTAATEGYPPNVELCRERLLPLGIDIKACKDAAHIPFADGAFDIIINRHGDFYPPEIRRLLKSGGLFVTQQVGSRNDRELVTMVLPDAEPPFPHENLAEQREAFEAVGFEILQAEEAFGPIRFYDVGAFVWFARIIEWEFPGFSVDRCFDRLLQLQETVERTGRIEGTTHRYLIVAKKPKLAPYFRPRQLMILSNCCISSPPFSGGFLLGGGGVGPGGAGVGKGTPRRRESSSARVGGSRGPTQRTYCSTPNRPRSARTCSARTRAQVSGWGGGEGGPEGQSGRFWFI